MDKPTTAQMNIVIARFMGLEGTDEFFRQNYQYHKSWDMLMPGWGKAAKVLFDIRGDLDDYKYIEAHRITKSFMTACQKVDIKGAHTDVYNAIQFIQWLNQNKNNG